MLPYIFHFLEPMTRSKENKIARILLLTSKDSVILEYLLVNYSLWSLIVPQWPKGIKKAFKIQKRSYTEEVSWTSFKNISEMWSSCRLYKLCFVLLRSEIWEECLVAERNLLHRGNLFQRTFLSDFQKLKLVNHYCLSQW